MPSSLRKLAILFDVENKSIFPYAFVNDIKITLDYNGPVPDFKYFNNTSLKEYQDYSLLPLLCLLPLIYPGQQPGKSQKQRKEFKNKNWNIKNKKIL